MTRGGKFFDFVYTAFTEAGEVQVSYFVPSYGWNCTDDYQAFLWNDWLGNSQVLCAEPELMSDEVFSKSASLNLFALLNALRYLYWISLPILMGAGLSALVAATMYGGRQITRWIQRGE